MSEVKFNLELDHTVLDPKDRYIHQALSISRKRMNFLVKRMKVITAEEEDERGDFDMSMVLKRVVAECETLGEVVICSYTMGERAGRKTGRSIGGLGGILGMIIGHEVPKGEGEGGGEDEDPSIDELIKKSYKINRRDKKRDDDNEEQ